MNVKKQRAFLIATLSILCTGMLFGACNTFEDSNSSNGEHVHTWGEKQTVAPTCTEQGYDMRTCTMCGEEEKSNFVEAGHTWKEMRSFDEEFHWLACKNCEEIKDEAMHTLGDDDICTGCTYMRIPTEGIVYEMSEDGTYATVVRYIGSLSHVNIAKDYQGVPVTSIGEGAFSNSYLTSVIIPDSVTSIDSMAFAGCTRLKSIMIGEGVEFIGNMAFTLTASLTRITVSEDNATYKSVDGNLYTKDGTTLIQYAAGKAATEFTVPNGVKKINTRAFSASLNLKSVIISNDVENIGEAAFSTCSNLESVVIGSGVTSIGEYAFIIEYGGLKSIVVDGNNANYKSIDGNLYTKDGTTLLQYAIGKETTSFAIPDGVTMIGDSAFYNCSNLTDIIIPESVTTIGDSAFYNCSKIENVTMPTLAIPYIPQTNLKTVVITSGETIGNYAFSSCGTLTDVRILEGIISIGDSAFSRCENLTNLTIPDGVITIGDSAFYNCSNLTDVIIPESVTTIGDSAFNQCSNLTDITLSNNVTSIGYDSFYHCEKIENVTMPALAIPYIPTINFKTVVITSGEAIENEAFVNCGHLTSLTLPDSITAIGINAFYNCQNLTCITFNGIVEQWNAIEKSFWCKENVSTPKIVCLDGELTKEGHLWGEVQTVAPTCTEQGYDVIKCALCEVEKERSNYTPIQHTWGEEVQTVAPTCTEQGYDIIKCTLCEVEEKSNFVDAEHTWGEVQTVAPTCTEQGYDVIKCILCEIEQQRDNFVDAEHTWGKKQTVAPTCTEQGYDVIKCILCEVEQQRDNFVDARHTWKDARSFDEKSHWFECVYCEEIKDKAVHKIKTDDTCLECEYVRIPTEGVEYEISSDHMYATVIGYTGTSTHVNIARYQYLDGDLSTMIPVTIIGDDAFKSCNILKSINIPDSVTSIGANAFYNCDALQEIIIPDSVTTIGVSAFQSCNALTNIEIGDGVTTIGDSAFYNCSNLTNIIIPDNVTSIGDSAFSHCDGLTSIIIPDGVTTLGEWVFSSCTNLRSAIIGDNVCSIGEGVFYRCYNLTGMEIGNGVVSIGGSAFSDCRSLTSVVIPNNVVSIGHDAFRDCHGLKRLVIGTGVTSINNLAFYYCTTLTEIHYNATECADWTATHSIFDKAGQNGAGITVTIGANVKKIPAHLFHLPISSSDAPKITMVVFEEESVCETIGSYAFYGCSSLTSITIPDSVTKIGASAFSNCNSLTSITIPDSVTKIGASVFQSCNALTNIEIGNGITSIGQNAFYNCSSLTSINVDVDNANYKSIHGNLYTKDGTTLMQYAIGKTAMSFAIPDGVTTIGDSAFYNCSNLTNIIIPDSVTSIGNFAFRDCDSLTSVTIGDGVTSIFDFAFRDCDSLTSVYITDIEAWCKISFSGGLANPLYYAKNLYLNNELVTELEIPNTVTEIKDYAFYGCTGLTSVVIPDSVISIGDKVFYGCTGLTSVGIGEGVTSIGFRAFFGCSGLTSITIPERVTTIGLEAFFGCGGLTEIRYNAIECADIEDREPSFGAFSGAAGVRVIVGAKVKRLPGYLFGSCDSLTSITIPDSVTSIGNFAFAYCDSLTSVTIGNGVTSIGAGAFSGCDSLTSVYISSIEAWCNISFANPSANPLNYAKNLYLNNELVTELEIPNTVTEIKDYAFYGCTGLTSVVIPDSVISIGDKVFYGCTGLTSVGIGDGVTNIGFSAFSGCSGLTSITLPFVGAKAVVTESDTQYPFGYIFGTSRYTGGIATNQYVSDCNSPILISVTYYIPTSLRFVKVTGGNILNGAFENCNNLTSITIGDSVTSIGNSAFAYCDSLTSVTIGNGVTSIGAGAFSGCDSLTSINVDVDNANYKSIDGNLYAKDGTMLMKYAIGKAATSFTIPDGVKTIGAWAFYDCSNLTDIIIPESVTSIGNAAFYNCSSLVSIVIPDSVTGIDSSAFSNCSSLTSITIGDGVTFISDGAFSGCSALMDISISTDNISYRSIDGNLYTKDGKTLIKYAIGKTATSFTVPDGVTSIAAGAFNSCKNLTSITLSIDTTSIGSAAFYACSNLTSITFSGTQVQWENVEKGVDWNLNTSITTIICKDGIINHTPKQDEFFQ